MDKKSQRKKGKAQSTKADFVRRFSLNNPQPEIELDSRRVLREERHLRDAAPCSPTVRGASKKTAASKGSELRCCVLGEGTAKDLR